MRIVVLTTSLAERDAVLRDLGQVRQARLAPYAETRVASPGAGTVVVLPTGAGPAAAAAAGVALNRLQPGAALSMGLAAGLADGVVAGSAVLADQLVPIGTDLAPYDVAAHAGALLARVQDRVDTAGVPLAVGAVLSVPAAARAGADADERRRRYPRALAEAGDGYAVAAAGEAHAVPVLELRTVAGAAGFPPDDLQVDLGLDALSRVAAALFAREWRPGPAPV